MTSRRIFLERSIIQLVSCVMQLCWVFPNLMQEKNEILSRFMSFYELDILRNTTLFTFMLW